MIFICNSPQALAALLLHGDSLSIELFKLYSLSQKQRGGKRETQKIMRQDSLQKGN